MRQDEIVLIRPRLKGVLTAVLLGAFYSVDGDVIGGAPYSARVSRICCPAS